MSRFALALLVTGWLVGPGQFGPRYALSWDDGEETYRDDAPDPGEFDEALAPDGDWVEAPEYGRVWAPRVAVGWQPYVDGYWSWSPWGWFWVSYEPWAWTFHYGRWALVPPFGWVWVPGTVWGPAWVDWYWGAGYVGWAPLAPFVSHVTVVERFVFVHDRDFCSRGIARRVRTHHHVPDLVIREWRHRDFRSPDRHVPDRHAIERVSAHPVAKLERRPAESVFRGRGHGGGGQPRDLGRPERKGKPGRPGGSEPRLGGGAARSGRGLGAHQEGRGGARPSRPPAGPGVDVAPRGHRVEPRAVPAPAEQGHGQGRRLERRVPREEPDRPRFKEGRFGPRPGFVGRDGRLAAQRPVRSQGLARGGVAPPRFAPRTGGSGPHRPSGGHDRFGRRGFVP